MRAVGGAAAPALENERLARSCARRPGAARVARPDRRERDAARRRIERDLHDGAQQQLVALALTLRTARSRLERDPNAAGRCSTRRPRELDAAIRELRELARGIHPAVLSDRGLGAALESLAQRTSRPVEIAGARGAAARGVEAATYFVVANSDHERHR